MELRSYINLGLLLLVLIVGLYLATKFGYIHCSYLPHWCKIYGSINTALYGRVYPNVIILYGEEGMGHPQQLANYLRTQCRLHVRAMPLARVGPANLENYDAVIVERAKHMSAHQLEMLWDFVAGGGKLVVVGDAGTEGNDYLTWRDLEENKEGLVNPWDRKKEDGTIIGFGTNLLGLKYITTVAGEGTTAIIKFNKDLLTEGLPESLPLEAPLAVVIPTGNPVLGSPKVVAVADGLRAIGGHKPPYPAIVRIGFRLAYFAYPPEDGGPRHRILLLNLCEFLR